MCLGDHEEQEIFSLTLGIECRYRAPWWIVKFCHLCRIRLPSSMEVCSARSTFKSVCISAFSQSNTAFNIRSSVWAFAQLVTCISTSGWPAVMHTSSSKHWSLPTMAGLWTLALYTIPKVTPSRMDSTVLGSSQVVTQLSTSTTVLPCPFWYSNLKLNCARAPTHQWPIASRLGVDIIYLSRLLSLCTTNDW